MHWNYKLSSPLSDSPVPSNYSDIYPLRISYIWILHRLFSFGFFYEKIYIIKLVLFVFIVCGALHSQFTSLANLFDIYGKADSANGYFASKQNRKNMFTESA